MRQSIALVLSVVLFNLNAAADPWLGEGQTLAADEDHQYEPVVAYNSIHDEFMIV